jgi:hypothetical protein
MKVNARRDYELPDFLPNHLMGVSGKNHVQFVFFWIDPLD